MRKYDKIFEYTDYLENKEGKDFSRCVFPDQGEDGVITLPFYVYDAKFTDFIKELYETDLLDEDYHGTLKKYNMNLSEDLKNHIDEADLELLKAVLTFFVRSDRFCTGAWAQALEAKVFHKIIVRLKVLQENCLA